MKKRLLALVSGFLIMGLIFSTSYTQQASATIPGTNTLISSSTTGAPQGGSYTRISADGKFVSFVSNSANLVTGDTNGKTDLFIRELSTNITTRVSVSTSGVEANNNTGNYAISRTGRYIAFTSDASNLIDGQTMTCQVYIRDMEAAITSLVTQTSGGIKGAGCPGGVSGVSSDGRFVTFIGNYTNLATLSDNGSHIFVADRNNNTFRVLNDYTVTAPTGVNASGPMTNCDGTMTVFISTDPIDSSDTDTKGDVYLADTRNGTSLTNITALSTTATINANPYISCSGDYITFMSNDHNYTSSLLSPTDTYNHSYTYSRVSNTFKLNDQSNAGIIGNSDAGAGGILNPVDDMGNVVFWTRATNMTTASISNYPTPGSTQLWLRNNASNTTELLTKNSSGAADVENGTIHGTDAATPLDINLSADGKIAAYTTHANNIVAADTDHIDDSYASLTGL